MDKELINKEIITVFSQRLAGYLMYNGFVVGGMRPDDDGSGRNVFFFRNSDSILGMIKKYRSLHPNDRH